MVGHNVYVLSKKFLSMVCDRKKAKYNPGLTTQVSANLYLKNISHSNKAPQPAAQASNLQFRYLRYSRSVVTLSVQALWQLTILSNR